MDASSPSVVASDARLPIKTRLLRARGSIEERASGESSPPDRPGSVDGLPRGLTTTPPLPRVLGTGAVVGDAATGFSSDDDAAPLFAWESLAILGGVGSVPSASGLSERVELPSTLGTADLLPSPGAALVVCCCADRSAVLSAVAFDPVAAVVAADREAADAPEAAAVVDLPAASPSGDTAGRTARRSRGSAEAGAALAVVGVAVTEARAPPDAAAGADGLGVPAALAGEAADGGTVDVGIAVTGVAAGGAAAGVVAGGAAGAAAGC